MKTIISTKEAPNAIGPYNQATGFENLIFTSGQIPLVPETMEIASTEIKEQSVLVMDNLNAVLKEAGSSMNNILKTTCYLSDMNNFSAFNEIYAKYFTSDDTPARATVAVKTLPLNVLVEVDAIAFKN